MHSHTATMIGKRVHTITDASVLKTIRFAVILLKYSVVRSPKSNIKSKMQAYAVETLLNAYQPVDSDSEVGPLTIYSLSRTL